MMIHVPKTAGSSIRTCLQDELGMQDINYFGENFPNRGSVYLGHAFLPELLRTGLISDDYLDNSFKFAVMRNPYERFQSLFFYLRQIQHTKASSELELMRIIESQGSQMDETHPLFLARPQSDWILGNDGSVLVDAIFKMERLDKLEAHFKRLGLDMVLQKVKISHKFDSGLTTSEREILDEKISVFYRRDFELGHYKPLRRE